MKQTARSREKNIPYRCFIYLLLIGKPICHQIQPHRTKNTISKRLISTPFREAQLKHWINHMFPLFQNFRSSDTIQCTKSGKRFKNLNGTFSKRARYIDLQKKVKIWNILQIIVLPSSVSCRKTKVLFLERKIPPKIAGREIPSRLPTVHELNSVLVDFPEYSNVKELASQQVKMPVWREKNNESWKMNSSKDKLLERTSTNFEQSS